MQCKSLDECNSRKAGDQKYFGQSVRKGVWEHTVTGLQKRQKEQLADLFDVARAHASVVGPVPQNNKLVSSRSGETKIICGDFEMCGLEKGGRMRVKTTPEVTRLSQEISLFRTIRILSCEQV